MSLWAGMVTAWTCEARSRYVREPGLGSVRQGIWVTDHTEEGGDEEIEQPCWDGQPHAKEPEQEPVTALGSHQPSVQGSSTLQLWVDSPQCLLPYSFLTRSSCSHFTQ